jgi:hypothetical protein
VQQIVNVHEATGQAMLEGDAEKCKLDSFGAFAAVKYFSVKYFCKLCKNLELIKVADNVPLHNFSLFFFLISKTC